MLTSAHYRDGDNYLLKTQESAVLGSSLSNTDGGGRGTPLPSACLPGIPPSPSPPHDPPPPVWGRHRRGSSAPSLKDRKWLTLPPGVRWVGSEGRLGKRVPDSKSSTDGRVARAGISEMTVTSALGTLPRFPRPASQSTAVNCFPSIFTAWLTTRRYLWNLKRMVVNPWSRISQEVSGRIYWQFSAV